MGAGRKYLAVKRAAHQAKQERLAQLRMTIEQLDAMTWKEFEVAICELMIRDGIAARHVGMKGDRGRRRARPRSHPRDGVAGPGQAPRSRQPRRLRRHPESFAGTARPIHGADFDVVITNRAYTRDARTDAALLGVHLIDRALLTRWASDGASLYQILGITPGRANGHRPTA